MNFKHKKQAHMIIEKVCKDNQKCYDIVTERGILDVMLDVLLNIAYLSKFGLTPEQIVAGLQLITDNTGMDEEDIEKLLVNIKDMYKL